MSFVIVDDVLYERVQPIDVDVTVQLPTLEMNCKNKVLEAYLNHTVVRE